MAQYILISWVYFYDYTNGFGGQIVLQLCKIGSQK